MKLADIKKLVSEEGKIVIVAESGEVVLVAMNFDEYKKIKSRQCQEPEEKEEIPFDSIEPMENELEPESIIDPMIEEFNSLPQQPAMTQPEMSLPLVQPMQAPVIAQEKELTVEDLPF